MNLINLEFTNIEKLNFSKNTKFQIDIFFGHGPSCCCRCGRWWWPQLVCPCSPGWTSTCHVLLIVQSIQEKMGAQVHREFSTSWTDKARGWPIFGKIFKSTLTIRTRVSQKSLVLVRLIDGSLHLTLTSVSFYRYNF